MAVWRLFGDKVVPERALLAAPDMLKGMEEGAWKAGIAAEQAQAESASEASMESISIGAIDNLAGFTQVGLGTPLTVDIRYAYSGRVGVTGTFGDEKDSDIAIVSGVKDWTQFKASARGLNWVAENKGKRESLGQPGALDDGTALVCYQKAVATERLAIGFELASAGRDKGIGQKIGNLFSSAAGIPLLMPYAGFLMAAGKLVPAVFKLLKSITERRNQWEQPDTLDFELHGGMNANAGFRLIAASTAPFGNNQFKFDPQRGIIDANGQPYSGDEPYIVIAIDGRQRPRLEQFTAAVVGAEMLSRFKLADSPEGGFIDELLDLTKIISDVKFREEASLLKKAINDTADPAEKAKLQKEFDAIVKNILSNELKP